MTVIKWGESKEDVKWVSLQEKAIIFPYYAIVKLNHWKDGYRWDIYSCHYDFHEDGSHITRYEDLLAQGKTEEAEALGDELNKTNKIAGFGGVGPVEKDVISKIKMTDLFLDHGFVLDREIAGGAEHYGLIFRKKV